MKKQIKLSIIDTFSYFDLFSYPLTVEQLELFLHKNTASKRLIKECLEEIPIIEEKYNYYFFSGRRDIAIKRKAQEQNNLRKLEIALKYSSLLSFVPGVKLIALTGSASMGNASRTDDIDLFIITRKNTLWITRFLVLALVRVLGKKRKYKSTDVTDKLCINMFLDERELEFSDKNIYVAHEIAQMKILFDEQKTFNNLFKRNSWIQSFFPSIGVLKKRKGRQKRWFDFLFFSEKALRVVNFAAFIFQYLYMFNKITREKVTFRKAFFHPNDISSVIINEYKKRYSYYLDLYYKAFQKSEFEAKTLSLKRHRIDN